MKNGFFPVLFLIFLTLKLCDVIAWSWWWVTCPLWGPLVVASVYLGITFAAAAILDPMVARSKG
jgi:hypothetical protein